MPGKSPKRGVILRDAVDDRTDGVVLRDVPGGPKRGGIPSPRSALAAAVPYVAVVAIPGISIVIPQGLSYWRNDAYGDCVTAEEAFAEACSNPEIFISYDDVVAWAKDVLDGATLIQVLALMQNDGFTQPSSSYVYEDGGYYSVDWTDAGILRSAISQGPVKLGVAGDQIQTAWDTTNGLSGWFATGFQQDNDQDHCVSLCGYGTMSWLVQQPNSQVPAGVAGTDIGYAVFSWNSIGMINVASMLAITYEAWLRKPTTAVSLAYPELVMARELAIL